MTALERLAEALERDAVYPLLITQDERVPLAREIRALLASGMETRQGGDVKQAPSQSDDSPTRQGDAQSQPLGNPLDTGDGK